MSRTPDNDEFLCGLEAAVRDELVEVDMGHAEYVLSLPVSEWLFDPMEAGLLTVRLRSLLGAVEALRSWHPPVMPSPGTRTADRPPVSLPTATSTTSSSLA